MNNVVATILQAKRIVFLNKHYVLFGIICFVIFLTLYIFVLPATYTGGRIGLVSLKFLNLKLSIFAFIFSSFLAIILPFAIYAVCKKSEAQKSLSSAGSFLGSVLPPLLCCSPILPSLAALAGGVFPVAFGISGFIQGFMATFETQIFITISIILAYSLYQNSKQVINAEQGVCAY